LLEYELYAQKCIGTRKSI